MGLNLRPYQLDAVNAIDAEWEKGIKKTLLVLPTGCGKTLCFSETTRRQTEKGNRTLILAHRMELLEQAAEKLKKFTGIDSALDKADSYAAGTMFPVVVGSIQTLMRDTRLLQYDPDEFSTVIVDEAHHALSNSYQKVLGYFDANVLGVTATPDRGDMKNLGQFFETLAYEYTLPQAIREGYLCPIKAQTIPLNIDLSGVKTQNGDYAVGDLGTALDPYLEQIADIIAEKYADRKTVAFLPLVVTSQRFKDLLTDRGVKAWEVNGNSEDRTEILADYEQAKSGVLCNSMLLTEGWDCPSVDCVVVLRPTKVRSLYCQMIGRGTRLSESKDHLLILDFLWHTTRHELCRPTCLICKKEEIAARMDQIMDESGEPMNISDETVEQVFESVREEREAALARELAEQRRKKAKLVDIMQYEYSIRDAELQDYEPTFGWETDEPTQGQLSAIEKFGLNAGAIQTKGYASMLLDRLIKRSSAGLSTPKQIKCLERYGFKDVGLWSFQSASKMIGALASRNWAVPYGFKPEEYVPKDFTA